MTGKNKAAQEEVQQPEDLCSKCGTLMVEEDGIKFCPHCDGDIDYFGEEDDEF